MGWFYSPIRGKNFWKHLLMLSGLPQYNQSKLFLVFAVLDARFTFRHIANCDWQALFLLWQHKENHSILAYIKFTITTSTGWKDVHTQLLFHGWVKTKSGESSSNGIGVTWKWLTSSFIVWKLLLSSIEPNCATKLPGFTIDESISSASCSVILL